MKKIISNKVYDTSTAKWIAAADLGEPGSLDYAREVLYQKKTGEYFLHGEGGPRTKYAHATDNNGWAGGEKILPLTYQAAQQWVRENLSEDEAQKLQAVPEDDVRINAVLPAGTAAKLRRMASEQETSLTAILIDLIDKA